MADYGVFGTWVAGYTEDMKPIPTPIGEPCSYCDEAIVDGDNGAVMKYMGTVHRECSLRSVAGGIGHQVNHEHYCLGELGTDAGLSRRRSAELVWAMLVEGRRVTEAILELERSYGHS